MAVTRRREGRSEALRRWLSLAICLAVVGLLGIRLVTERASAERAVGIFFEDTGEGLLVTSVGEGKPAERGGMRVDDVIVALAGVPVSSALDYDSAIQSLSPGETVAVEVMRRGESKSLELQPGVPFEWIRFALNTVTALVYLVLAGLVLAMPRRGPRVNLLLVLLLSIAVEMALPIELIGLPRLEQLIWPLFWMLAGLQFAIELNLASLIPARHQWLQRAPWASTLFWVIGLGYGAVMVAPEIPALAGSALVGWMQSTAGLWVLEGWYLLWPLGVFALLTGAAFGWPDSLGRSQALLVWLGVVPWTILGVTTAVQNLRGIPYPAFLDYVEPFVLLLYPLAIFIALYRYHLFDFQLVLRQGLLYSALVTTLLLAFYAVLGGAGAFLSTFVDDPATSVWVVGGATLVLGLLFGPLRQLLERQIERRFFPERRALRRRLGELARELPRGGSLPAICDQLVAELRQIFALDGVTLCLPEGESALLSHRASSPERVFGGACGALSLADDDALMRALTERRRPVALADGKVASQLAERFRGAGVEVVQPITGDGQLQGLLLLSAKSQGTPLAAEEAELLDLFSHHVSTVLENARLFESATIDGLTGLLRREALLTRLDSEVERAVRYGRPLTVAMLDLDEFKRINDGYGHLLGDLALQRVSATLAECLRKTDAVGRYGGDEFLVLLPETTAGGAAKVCEMLRQRIEELEVPNGGPEPAQVTLSIGLAELGEEEREEAPSPEDLVRAADAALYAAKRAGGNRIVLASDDDAAAPRRFTG